MSGQMAKGDAEAGYEQLNEEGEPHLTRKPFCFNMLIATLKLLLAVVVLAALALIYQRVAPDSFSSSQASVLAAYASASGWVLEDFGGEQCDAGLIIPGPDPSRANVIIFMTLLLWSFIGVSIASDIFMVKAHVVSLAAARFISPSRCAAAHFGFSLWPLMPRLSVPS